MHRSFAEAISPLEQFVRDYAEARGGAWDEIEPQVYDLLVGSDLLEVAFDPEALPEHPNARLASLGSPLLDGLLTDATQRWSVGQFHRIGLNLHPHDLESRLRRAISVPSDATLAIGRIRAMNCPQALFWLKATFVSDQKEEEILPIGIDLHYLREVRHLEQLTDPNRLSELPEVFLPDAPHASLIAGYQSAQKRIAPTIASLANNRRREWSGRVDKQIDRMSAYYAQLRQEAQEQATRGADPAAAAARAAARCAAIDQEQRLRIAELRQKSAIHVQVKLSSLMIVQQPKLLIWADLTVKGRPSGRLEAVWDPLFETIEAIACPTCGQPTFIVQIHRNGPGCQHCSGPRRPMAPAGG
jgi:hypothetical protein